MPKEGVDLTPDSEILTTPEILRLATVFASQGVNKIRLTGGEPTLRKDLVTLVGKPCVKSPANRCSWLCFGVICLAILAVKAVVRRQIVRNRSHEGVRWPGGLADIDGINTVAMTSNGIVLHRSLAELQAAGLSVLNISLDTLFEPKYQIISRRRGLSRVLKNIDLAIELGFTPKVNVVVMKGVNEDELVDFVALTEDKAVDVRFIEYMPFGGESAATPSPL